VALTFILDPFSDITSVFVWISPPFTLFIITSVGRAPSFTRIKFLTEFSPKITDSKSKIGLLHLTRAFFGLHIKGMLIGPVSASNGKTASISSVNYG